MEVGEEANSKDLLSSATHTTIGKPNCEAPAFHTANATEVCCKEGGRVTHAKHLLPGSARGLLSLACAGAPLQAL